MKINTKKEETNKKFTMEDFNNLPYGVLFEVTYNSCNPSYYIKIYPYETTNCINIETGAKGFISEVNVLFISKVFPNASVDLGE